MTVEDDDLFRIDKVVKRKGNKVLVRWKGWPDKYDTWLSKKERIDQTMSDFHVQLLSNASTAEFPSNQPNHFKNRMPYPLQFREPGWKVGVSAMSLPEAPRKMKLKNPFLFRFQWLELVEPDYSIYAEESVTIREGDLVNGAQDWYRAFQHDTGQVSVGIERSVLTGIYN